MVGGSGLPATRLSSALRGGSRGHWASRHFHGGAWVHPGKRDTSDYIKAASRRTVAAVALSKAVPVLGGFVKGYGKAREVMTATPERI